MRRFDEALAAYDRAITLEPNRSEFHSDRAVLLRDMRQLPEALAASDRAVALASPQCRRAYYHRGTILQDLGCCR